MRREGHRRRACGLNWYRNMDRDRELLAFLAPFQNRAIIAVLDR
jgi:hypothetical protein